MQSVSSKIWTRVAVSISYNDNHYTTGTLLSYFIAFWPLIFVHVHLYFQLKALSFYLSQVMRQNTRSCVRVRIMYHVTAFCKLERNALNFSPCTVSEPYCRLSASPNSLSCDKIGEFYSLVLSYSRPHVPKKIRQKDIFKNWHEYWKRGMKMK